MTRLLRALAGLGGLCAGTIVGWLLWHTWPLTAAAPLTWRLAVLLQNIGLYVGLLGSFALAAFGSPRVRRVGWALVAVLLVGTALWTVHSLGGVLAATILPFGVPDPSESESESETETVSESESESFGRAATPAATPDATHQASAPPSATTPLPLTDTEREQLVGTIYTQHADLLCRFADRVLQQRGRHLRAVTAADLVHDAFALLLSGERDAILRQGDEATRRYLVGVIKHTVGDQSRTARRRSTLDRRRHETSGTPMTDAPDLVYTTAELELRIQEVLATAPASEVAAYQAVRVDALSYAEAATQLGTSPEMIGVLLTRLGVRFRHALRDWPVPPPKRRGRRNPKARPPRDGESSHD